MSIPGSILICERFPHRRSCTAKRGCEVATEAERSLFGMIIDLTSAVIGVRAALTNLTQIPASETAVKEAHHELDEVGRHLDELIVKMKGFT